METYEPQDNPLNSGPDGRNETYSLGALTSDWALINSTPDPRDVTINSLRLSLAELIRATEGYFESTHIPLSDVLAAIVQAKSALRSASTPKDGGDEHF